MKKYLNLILNLLILLFVNSELQSMPKPDFISIDSLKDKNIPYYTPLANLSYDAYFGIKYIDSLNAVRILIKMTSDNGFIVQHTIDGGYNWNTTYVDTSYKFIDTNGKKQYYFPTHLFEEVYYISKDSCIIACNNGLTLFSNDNCETWQKKLDSINITYYFFNKRDVLVKSLWKTKTGYPNIENERFTTTDKGKTWIKIKFPDENLKDYYYQIQIIDSNSIFFPFFNGDSNMVTKPKIYLIREQKWETLPVTSGFSGFLNTEVLSRHDFTRVTERNIDSIIYRYIIRSRDGGYTWDTLFKIKGTKLYRVKYFDSLNVLAWGPTNVLIKSTDGGRNWKFQQVENYSNDSASLDTTWYYLNFYQACWPELNSIYVVASSSILYKYVPNANSIDDFLNENNNLQVYPNPANKGEPIYLQLSGLKEGNYELEIRDILGRKYYSHSGYFSPVQTLVQIDADIASGAYFLILRNSSKIVSVNKILIK